jgi:iron complex outermembrane recepter protein
MLTNRMRRWVAPGAAALLCLAGQGYAQPGALTGVQRTAEGDIIETMVVTGSRIPRAGFDTMLPATVINAEFLEAGGFTNAADALNDLPSFGLPASSTQGDQSGFSVGQNFVNFFGLGSQRTLTLVNGRRFVSSNAPTIFSDGAPGLQVDMNVIPSSMIERIETIAVGGAPIYGADAIAGTVNIILKEDFEGFEIGGSFGKNYDEGDMEEEAFNLLYGINFADGRGNLVFGFERTDRQGLIQSDRKHLARSWQFREPVGDSDFDRVLVDNAYANIVSRGGVATPGPFLIPNFGLGQWGAAGYLQFAPDGSLVPYDVGEPTGNAVWSLGGEGLFLPDVTNLFTPYDRTLVNSYLTYELADNVEFFGEFFYANTNARELINQSAYQSGLFGEESDALNFSVDHPLLSESARQTLTGLGTDNFWLQRASIDLGDRRIDQELNLWRAVAGLRGDFELGGRNLNWDVAFIRGKSDSETRQNELVNDRFFYALDVVEQTGIAGSTAGELVCAVNQVTGATGTGRPIFGNRPEDPAGGFGTNLPQDVFDDCVPLDIFGEGRASAEAIDYITAAATSRTSIEQQVFSVNANMDVFDLPAGSVFLGVGYENRREDATFATGGLMSLGLGRAVPIGSTAGGYKTNEYYAEFYAPLVSEGMDIPFLQRASLEGAYRVVDNSLAGKDNIWTIGGRFAPIQDVELRGNVTRSVRAPAITELFLPLSGVFSFATDPCDFTQVSSGPAPETRRANCQADGIDTDTFVSSVRNASVQGRTGGNTGLENEVADAWTVGAVFRPRWVEGLTMAIDYIEIDIEEAIENFTLTQVMESCYDQVDFPNDFCDQFTRLPSGQLPATNAFVSGYVNAGERTYRGVTVDAEYFADLSAWNFIGSRFANPGTLNVAAFLYLPREDKIIVGSSVDDRHGEPGNSRVQLQLNTRYLRDDWSVFLQSRFIGEARISNEEIRSSRDIGYLDSVWLFNAGFAYDVNEMIRLQLNVRNIFDKKPEPAAIASGFSNVYDNLGRYIRAGVKISL